MECLLKVGYKAEVKKWALRSDADKEKVKAKKNLIQSRFKNEVGLVIDIPRSGGSGLSNNGNTARRFFRNAEQTAAIINVDVHLIKRIYVVLCTLSSGFMIDADKLEDYCSETAQLFIQLYPWYYMPQSLHKILIHEWQFVNEMVLPIGMMSEEALEARNKDFKKFREFFSRKCSRLKTNEDLLRRFMCSSDPVISALRSPKHPKKENFPDGVVQLLKERHSCTTCSIHCQRFS